MRRLYLARTRGPSEPPLYTLEDAPEGHEPETPEEAEAVAEAWREHREGKSFTTEEVKRELGLS